MSIHAATYSIDYTTRKEKAARLGAATHALPCFQHRPGHDWIIQLYHKRKAGRAISFRFSPANQLVVPV